MKTLARFLLIVCIMSVRTDDIMSVTEQIEGQLVTATNSEPVIQNSEKQMESVSSEARSIDSGYENDFGNSAEQHAAFRKRAKPLKNIFMGIYKNYKSTYLGNRTTEQYKQKLKERNEMQHNVAETETTTQEVEINELMQQKTAENEEEEEQNDEVGEVEEAISPTAEDALEWMVEKLNESTTSLLSKKRHKRKRKQDHSEQQQQAMGKKRVKIAVPAGADDPLLSAHDNTYRYDVGPGLNMSLDMENDVISVNLDGNNLRDIVTGHWLGDNSEQGRGKKYDMVTKVLPLFILPFLIQSAIVPFLVTKLKLLLMKSILVGKLAIFLLIISAIKNSNKMMQTYEVAPSYWAGEPSRRSELATAASSAAYNGYRVEGKPTTWIN